MRCPSLSNLFWPIFSHLVARASGEVQGSASVNSAGNLYYRLVMSLLLLLLLCA